MQELFRDRDSISKMESIREGCHRKSDVQTVLSIQLQSHPCHLPYLSERKQRSWSWH